jgi:hypothetical protein
LNAKFIEFDDITKIYAASLCVSGSDAVIAKGIPEQYLIALGSALPLSPLPCTQRHPPPPLCALRIKGIGNKNEIKKLKKNG